MPVSSIVFSLGAAGVLLGIMALIDGSYGYAVGLGGGGVLLILVALVMTGMKLEAEEAGQPEAGQEPQASAGGGDLAPGDGDDGSGDPSGRR